MNNWKEYIFYVTASVLYLIMGTLIMYMDSSLWLKMTLAVGLIVNHLILAFLVFRYDIDGGKNDRKPRQN